MKQRWRLWLGLALLFLVAGWMVAPSVYWRSVGWWRGEAFYRGRPTSYWETEIQDRSSRLAEGSLQNNPVLFSLPTWWEQLFAKLGVSQPISITKAALLEGADQRALLQLALDNYLAVWDTRYAANDPFWVKKAGLQALALAGQLGVSNPDKFIDDLEKVFPQLADSLEKKRTGLPVEKK